MQHEHLGLEGQAATDQHALLIAARQRLHRVAEIGGDNLQLAGDVRGQRAAAAGVNDAKAAAEAVEHLDDNVVADRLFEEQSFRQSIFGDIADARVNGVDRAVERNGLAVDADVAAVGRRDAGKRPRQLVAARVRAIR